jgi:uncharacterized protein
MNVFSQIKGVRWLRALATGVAGAYLVIGLILYFQQNFFLFPAPQSYPRATPADAHLAFDDLHIAVNDRGNIHSWWIPASEPSDKVILMFHGNGYVLEDMATSEAATLHEIGVNLLLVDYRGYGGSSGLKPNESTVNEDARAALNYLRGLKDLRNIYVLGRSIGSGAATQLALENPGLGGLILESPFSSVDDAARVLPVAHLYPVHWMLLTHFDNSSKIGSVRVPLLVVSGTADTLTPVWMAKEIFEKANQPKQIELIPGAGHNDLLFVGGQKLTALLRAFVK